ncbi:MAG: hypothetical protein BA864_05445 [Desulfuromonadales bacterium C00003093]|nr:MAG: hypothetical protein BA864_05445 [Desulfuromonadales bacterium C00003093]
MDLASRVPSFWEHKKIDKQPVFLGLEAQRRSLRLYLHLLLLAVMMISAEVLMAWMSWGLALPGMPREF